VNLGLGHARLLSIKPCADAIAMSDVERALNLLIHDLRAPLSVAHGYLRLIKEERLESTEERARALAKAIEALGRISGLCTDASAFLREPARNIAAAPLLPAARVVELVCGHLEARAIPVHVHDSLDAVRMRLGPSSDAVADALATVVVAARQAHGGRPEDAALELAVRTHELQMLFGTAIARDQLVHEPRSPFDAWRGGHGLSLPLACRTIAEAGGEIWQPANGRGAVGIAFSVETSD